MLVLCGVSLVILVYMPLLGRDIIYSLVSRNWGDFRRAVITLGVVSIAQLIVGLIQSYAMLRLEVGVGERIRRRIVDVVLTKNLRFFEKNWVGDIVSRAINDSSALTNLLTGILLQIVVDVATLVVVVIFLVKMSATMTLISIATIPFSLLFLRQFRDRLESNSLNVQEGLARITGHLQSWLRNPLALKAYDLSPIAAKKFQEKNKLLSEDSVKAGFLGQFVAVVNTTLLSLPSLLIFGYGGFLVFSGTFGIGELFAFMTLMAHLNTPVLRLMTVVATIPVIYPQYCRVSEFLGSEDPDESAGKAPAKESVTGITARNVSFTRGENFHLVVPNFEARCGEVVAVVGANGSGKTTLARLLLGIYQPDSGQMQLRGTTRSPDAGTRGLFGVLPQEAVVFDGTLLENATLFESDPARDKVMSLAEQLGLMGWIDSLEDALDSKVNAGLSGRFSGGQMQRIGILRVIYRDPPIWILDEPSKGLDKEAWKNFKDLLKQRRPDTCVIVITHSQEAEDLCQRVYHIEARDSDVGAQTFECVEGGSKVQSAESSLNRLESS